MSERETYQKEVDYKTMMRRKKEEKEARLEVENNDAGLLLEHPTVTSPIGLPLQLTPQNQTGKLTAGDRSLKLYFRLLLVDPWQAGYSLVLMVYVEVACRNDIRRSR